MIPYLCPEMADTQKAALHKVVKTPLVYTTVAIRNWTAFHKLGISGAYAPGGYHTTFALNWPVDIGGVTAERSPDKPILIHMQRTPCRAGLPEFDQNKAGRAGSATTSFETFERNIRDQLGRALGPGGASIRPTISPASPSTAWPHDAAGVERPVGRTPARGPAAECHRPAALWGHHHRHFRRQRRRLRTPAPSTRRGGRWTNCWR